MALAIMLGALVVVAPAQARALAAGGDTLSIAMANGSNFVYGSSTTPIFTITLVLAAPPTQNNNETASVSIDNGPLIGSQKVSESSDQLTVVFQATTDGVSIVPGHHTASAQYDDPETGQTVYSGSVSFQMAKGNASLNCLITNLTVPVTPGQSLTFGMSFQGSSVDWRHGTYTITFHGPTTVQVSNVAPDSNDNVTVHAPSAIGEYGQPDCAFNGTSLYNGATSTAAGQPVLVSEEHALGAVQFFSNPTTLTAGQYANVYVVFHAAPGLPAPTGYFNIEFPNSYPYYLTRAITIGPGGATYVQIGPLPNLAGVTQAQISYSGDPYYNTAVVNFPLTNPPIPGGSGGGGGSGQATATPKPGTTPTTHAGAATTGSDAATPTVTTEAPNTLRATVTSGGSGAMVWLFGGAGAVILLGGAGGGFLVWSRRRQSQLAATSGAASVMAAPPPGMSPYDDRTLTNEGYQRGDE